MQEKSQTPKEGSVLVQTLLVGPMCHSLQEFGLTSKTLQGDGLNRKHTFNGGKKQPFKNPRKQK